MWGRNNNGAESATICGALLFLAPLFVIYTFISCRHFDCSILINPISEMFENISLMSTFKTFFLALFWYVFQLFLALNVPGKIASGNRTPAGHIIQYNINGLSCFFIGAISFFIGFLLRLYPLSVIYDHWGALLFWGNVGGNLLAFVAYKKALIAPTHENDRVFSGNQIYDYFMGIELNPQTKTRWGALDWKLFHNGRPGIAAWPLILVSFAAAQFNKFGVVSNGMLLLILLQCLYVLDFFVNEQWYVRTIDIQHDHFGFYLAWGDMVWLPWMYTLQAAYLVNNPNDLSMLWLLSTLFIGLLGFYIFRTANDQKDMFRKHWVKSNGAHNSDFAYEIWGRPVKYINTSYVTNDGQQHKSVLLVGGWWRMVRHPNYFGDLLISLAMCMCCGFPILSSPLLGYFYFIYMVVLLSNRCLRDEQKCSQKYGNTWQDYCNQVPFRIVPGVF